MATIERTRCFNCRAKIVRPRTQLSGHDRHFCKRACFDATRRTENDSFRFKKRMMPSQVWQQSLERFLDGR